MFILVMFMRQRMSLARMVITTNVPGKEYLLMGSIIPTELVPALNDRD